MELCHCYGFSYVSLTRAKGVLKVELCCSLLDISRQPACMILGIYIVGKFISPCSTAGFIHAGC